MPARPRLDDAQRRARLARRQLLAPPHRAAGAEEVAEVLVALHATDPATVFLSAAARLAEPGTADLERALYRDGSLIRMHGMRRTLFVVPADVAPIVQASTTRKVAEKQRRGFVAFAAGGGFEKPWLDEVQARALAALREVGEATGTRLGELVPELREQIAVAVGKPYESKQSIGSRMLTVLAMEGLVIRRRPVGSWTSGQHNWAPHAPYPDEPVAKAQAELTARWLAAYGPGTVEDLTWWTGWGVREVRAALAESGGVAVELEGGEGFVAPEDTGPVAEPEPWAALLPALDPTPMGWGQRDWYLPSEHRGELFDRSGNIGPTVWWNGRIVGGWAQRPDGTVAWELLDRPGKAAERAIAEEAARLESWVGEVRITPRFRTPLERRLTS